MRLALVAVEDFWNQLAEDDGDGQAVRIKGCQFEAARPAPHSVT